MAKVVDALIRSRRIGGCVVSPPKLEVEVNDTIKFYANDTQATVLIPHQNLANTQVLNIPLNGNATINITGGTEGEEYEYAIYGFNCKKVMGRGRFAKGCSPPKIIIG